MIEKELRGFIGSLMVFCAIMALLCVLFFIEVPDSNNDIVKVIIGMLVASLSMIMYTIAGKNPEELNSVKSENDILREENRQLNERVNHLERMFIELQERVINKLSDIKTDKV